MQYLAVAVAVPPYALVSVYLVLVHNPYWLPQRMGPICRFTWKVSVDSECLLSVMLAGYVGYVKSFLLCKNCFSFVKPSLKRVA